MNALLKSPFTAVLVAAAFAFGQAPAAKQTAKPTGAQESKFVEAAIEAGYHEIAMGQMALKKAASKDVKDVAEKLIDEHGEINEDLTKLARARGIDIPDFHDDDASKASAKSKAKGVEKAGAELAKLTGAAFDRKYASILVDAHLKSVQNYEQYIRSAKDGGLKEFAEDTLETIQEHLAMARSLDQKLSKTK